MQQALQATLRVAFSVLALGLGAAACAQEPPGSEDANPVEAIRGALDGSIVVGGSILGEDGRPLGDVKMTILTGRLDLTQPSLRSVSRESETVTASFRYECEPCTDVTLQFYKEGYYRESVAFVVARDGESGRVDQGRLTVRLRPAGEPVVLERLKGELQDLATGEPAVLPLNFGPVRTAQPKAFFDSRALAKGLSEGLDYVSLVVERGPEGKLAVRREPQAKSTSYDRQDPVDPALVFSSGGAVIHEPAPGTSVKQAFRDMEEAPAEGYLPRLSLDPTAEKPVYFFCKIGERYGKGKVRAPRLEETGERARAVAQVEIWLNPTVGDRNLVTFE